MYPEVATTGVHGMQEAMSCLACERGSACAVMRGGSAGGGQRAAGGDEAWPGKGWPWCIPTYISTYILQRRASGGNVLLPAGSDEPWAPVTAQPGQPPVMVAD